MFFKKKKKEELGDQFAAYKQRKAPRWGTPQYTLKAGISINGYEGEGQLGNISVSGWSASKANLLVPRGCQAPGVV